MFTRELSGSQQVQGSVTARGGGGGRGRDAGVGRMTRDRTLGDKPSLLCHHLLFSILTCARQLSTTGHEVLIDVLAGGL